uniref:ATP-dependent DNA helicase n=1 Tax=Daphnia galeata TaxID=27404 RepID=A0A8J2RQ30_9CRUS|nr:unnamed protein product [Daphnia galeata]
MDTINRLKIISRNDVNRDPTWMNAPIVPILGIVANGLNQIPTNYLYATCPQFRGIFVAGAPGFLMSNINPKRGLTNGTPVIFHSLVLDPREDRERLLTAMMQGNTEDISLQYNPLHILVKITNANPTDFIGMTAVQGEVVIPLSQTHTSKLFPITVPGKLNKIKLQTTSHGIDLGFSVTFHKIQGQTCSKLIVDLNHRPFMPQVTFSGLYVAVSRVRRGEDLRIMPIQPSSINLKFLNTLQPSKKLITWMNGYNVHGDWDARLIPSELLDTPLTTKRKKQILKKQNLLRKAPKQKKRQRHRKKRKTPSTLAHPLPPNQQPHYRSLPLRLLLRWNFLP